MRLIPRARWHRNRPLEFPSRDCHLPIDPAGGISARFDRRQSGFTLLEMMMVVIVIGVTAAVITPRWLENDLDVDATARQLQNDIRYAQGLAMTRGQRHRVYFDVATAYRIANNTGTTVTHPLDADGSVEFGNGVTLVSNGFTSGYVAFDGRGVPYNGATAIAANTSVQLSKSGTTRTVQVVPRTGYVTVTSP